VLTRITIALSDDEREALCSIAQSEMRGLREQARYLLVQEIRKRGSPIAHSQEENKNASSISAQ